MVEGRKKWGSRLRFGREKKKRELIQFSSPRAR